MQNLKSHSDSTQCRPHQRRIHCGLSNRQMRLAVELRCVRRATIASVLLAALFLTGCFRGADSPGGSTSKRDKSRSDSGESAHFDADETVAKTRAAYKSADAYSDRGQIHWKYLDGETWRETAAPFSTTFARPGRLDLHAHGLHVVCDGEQLRAVIVEEATDNYDGQMLQRKSADKLTLGELYADAEMSNILRGEVVDGTPWPLRLLLDDPALESWLAGGAVALGTQTLDGKTCRRVQVTNEGQTATLWIDPDTHMLRRVELPQVDARIGVRALVADYADATFAEAGSLPAARFRLNPPRRAKQVSLFVPPVIDELPSPHFGVAVDDFKFAAADGTAISRDSLAGDIVVLAWFLDNPESAVALAQLQAVARQFADNEHVRCYAVSPLPEMIADESIQSTLKNFKIELSLLRDMRAAGRDVFDVLGAPTIVVLDGQHRVQAYEAGVQRGLEQYLGELITHLLAGENPAGDRRRQLAKDREMYRLNLAGVSDDGTAKVVEIPRTPIATAHPPAKLKLTKLWTRDDIASPGNLLVLPRDDGETKILVHDHGMDWRTIVELNARGEVVKRRQLPVPETAAIALLRTAVDGDGRRWYAGSARLGQRVYVFNDQWELAFAYPPEDERHEGIGDFAIVDFQGDGKLQLCVGFWGVLGLHGVDMTGRRTWSNRTAAPVVSLAVSPANEAGWRQVLATTDRGQIVPVNGFGHNDPPQRVQNQAITHLIARGENSDALSPYIGLTVKPDGTSVGLMLTESLAPPDWEVPLPAGTHPNQIQWIVSGRLLPGRVGQWVFAGPDSSIGIVSDDASFFDSFAVGDTLTGLAVAEMDGKYILLVATDDTVTAWEVVVRPKL